ncbi:hypothetical protein [Chryseolinea soli]|uniref:Outer membrane protein beta-barrel domain-containing protein n=1 Tax=Chryseolinea soli TaxID=2321403 RepID=A0A385SWA7_9BACT|nr:hypothetical protein [Chryseolinea soli]AYB34245.1 hypothetical protein D4L85_28320 [Chryseolinea soli]
MSTRSRLFFLLFSLLTYQAVAQTDSVGHAGRKVRYWNNFLLGGLQGDHKQTSFSLATIHGVRVGRLAVGLGTGLDAYGDWKVFPLFASASFDFARVKNDAFFIQMNGGYGRAIYTGDREGMMNLDNGGGKMFNPMLGYRIKADRFRIYIAMGYKFQRNTYTYGYNYLPYDDFASSYEPPKYTIREDMQRLVLQMGFGWH